MNKDFLAPLYAENAEKAAFIAELLEECEKKNVSLEHIEYQDLPDDEKGDRISFVIPEYGVGIVLYDIENNKYVFYFDGSSVKSAYCWHLLQESWNEFELNDVLPSQDNDFDRCAIILDFLSECYEIFQEEEDTMKYFAS